MTSDTKIGLLLGLIFIFVVAFVINGLPGFDGVQGPNVLAGEPAGYPDASPDLGAREKDAQRHIENAYAFPSSDKPVRDQMFLPPVDPAVQDQATRVLNEIQPPRMFHMNPNLQQRTLSLKVAAWPKICEVKMNDNLAKIAKRYYGAENGNRAVNIKKIFEANMDILPSEDSLKVGQQLIIPALTSVAAKAIEEVTLPVESVDTPVPVAVSPARTRPYEVKEDDSLWKISITELGNGARYLEIKDLNSSTLSDENSLQPGMILQLPAS